MAETAAHPPFVYLDAEVSQQAQLMQCCQCGAIEEINPTRKCAACLRNEVDATADVEKQVMIQQCRGCGRFQGGQGTHNSWVAANWESKELMALCLKKTKGMTGRPDVRLVDAQLLYTEPHSRRVRIRILLQKLVEHGAVIEQSCVIEYVIQSVQCDDCRRAYTPHLWKAVVQIRQKADHKKSLLYLEQLILKHDAQENVLRMVAAPNGFDFQFGSKQAAQKFCDFVASVLPTKTTSSKSLVSHDERNNTANWKYTLHQEVCPVVKDDLVFLPRKVASLYGGLSSFLLCLRVSKAVRLVDPYTLRGVDIAGEKYWKNPFTAIFTRRHFTEFVVLDVELVQMCSVPTAATARRFLSKNSGKKPHRSLDKPVDEMKTTLGSESMQVDAEVASTAADVSLGTHGPGLPVDAKDQPFWLADVEIARASEIGQEGCHLQVRTHLGKFLSPGDRVLGYDLRTINLSGFDDCVTEVGDKLPFEAILVKKAPISKMRKWLLQKLPIDVAGTGAAEAGVADKATVEEFYQDIESDPLIRKDINLWKDPRARKRRFVKDTDMHAESAVAQVTQEGESEGAVDSEDDSQAEKLGKLLEGLTLEDAYEL